MHAAREAAAKRSSSACQDADRVSIGVASAAAVP